LPFSLPFLGNGIHVLPILMAGLTFVQQKATTNTETMNEQQKTMLVMMPIMLLFIFYSFPAGLVLYWLTNSFLTTSYQMYLKTTNK
jgi:YidC/Oxa1 family membrane protein insertase